MSALTRWSMPSSLVNDWKDILLSALTKSSLCQVEGYLRLW